MDKTAGIDSLPVSMCELWNVDLFLESLKEDVRSELKRPWTLDKLSPLIKVRKEQ